MKNRKYLIAITVGAVLTPTVVGQAYKARQYVAVGGEWLLIPLFLLLVMCTSSIKDFVAYQEKEKSITEFADSDNAHKK